MLHLLLMSLLLLIPLLLSLLLLNPLLSLRLRWLRMLLLQGSRLPCRRLKPQRATGRLMLMHLSRGLIMFPNLIPILLQLLQLLLQLLQQLPQLPRVMFRQRYLPFVQLLPQLQPLLQLLFLILLVPVSPWGLIPQVYLLMGPMFRMLQVPKNVDYRLVILILILS